MDSDLLLFAIMFGAAMLFLPWLIGFYVLKAAVRAGVAEALTKTLRRDLTGQ